MSSLGGADAGAVRWRFNDVFGHRGGAFAGGNGRLDRGLVGGLASGGRHGRRFAHGFSLPLCAAAGPNDRADGRLFGGFQQRRRAGAELFKQSCFVGLGGGEMTLLDVAEAADVFRDGGELNGEGMIIRRQFRQNLVEHGLVVGDQIALGAALERCGRTGRSRAAQAL